MVKPTHCTPWALRRSLAFARLSHAAYAPERQAAAATYHLGWNFYDLIDRGGTQALVVYQITDDLLEAAVVFRGTEPGRLEDWLADLKVCKKLGPFNCRVHAGFLEALTFAWPEITTAIEQLRTTARQKRCAFGLTFAGHSLGGALATLAAAKVLEQGGEVSGLWTFGAPRVGGLRFALGVEEWLGHRLYRWRNNNDLPARVPPAWWGYRHAGEALYIDRRGQLRPGLGFWASLWDRLAGRVEARAWRPLRWKTDGLDDHGIDEYCSVLEALADGGSP